MKNLLAITLAFVCIGAGYPRAVALDHDAVKSRPADQAGAPLFAANCGRSPVEAAKLQLAPTDWNGLLALDCDAPEGYDAAELGGNLPCPADGGTLRSQRVLLRL